jgi:hypothetical protein
VLDADQFVISTAVPQVCLDFGTPDERPIARMTLAEARQLPRRRAVRRGQHGAQDPRDRPLPRTGRHGGRSITRPQDLESPSKDGRARHRAVARVRMPRSGIV